MREMNNREAMTLALNFFKGNISLSLGAIVILIAVALLRFVPLLGIVFAIAYPVLSFSLQIYLARQIPDSGETDEKNEIGRIASETKLHDYFLRYIDIAAGGFAGFFMILLLLMMLFMAMIGGSVDMQTVSGSDMEAFAASISTSGTLGTLSLFLILSMVLGYLLPGVMGEVLLAESFGDAFKKSWKLFSPSYWKRTLNGDYFMLVLIWSAIVFVAALILSWLAVSIILLPVALIGIYCLSLYNAVIYVFAHRYLD
jgi:hypothetical protein